jgi:hypothetical protein
VSGALDNNGAVRRYFQNKKCESLDFGTVRERGSSIANDEIRNPNMGEGARWLILPKPSFFIPYIMSQN